MEPSQRIMTAWFPILSRFITGRFSLFLVIIALNFLVVPLIPVGGIFLGRVVDVLGLATLVTCLLAISKSRRFFFFMIGFAFFNFLLGSSNIIDHSSSTRQTFVLINQLLYFLIVFLSIMNYVLDSSEVTSDKLFGALSAYLLMGLIWAIAFSLFQHLNPESFNLSESMQASKSTVPMWAIYFSFTTLPSLGYGDITPQTPATQSYAVMEAALGQIFLTVVVARLVALQITHSKDKSSTSSN